MTAHLTISAAADLDLSDDERIARIRAGRWIGYTRARGILDRLEDLLVHPKIHRMPNLLIVGATNNGKTMITERFFRRHPPRENGPSEAAVVPVVSVQAPPLPDEARFYNAILERVYAPYKTSSRLDQKQFQVIALLKLINLRMLIIDEIHHVLAGNLLKQRHFLNVIKYLGNELRIPIVAVGTREAFSAINTDPQLSNRFEAMVLPQWEMGNDYLRLLASFESLLPLRNSSNLAQANLALKILSMTEGSIGEIADLLQRAAVKAITNGSERISAKTLATVDWVSPSERRRRAV